MTEDKKSVKSINRRNFLKTAGGAAAVAGLATTGVAMKPWTAEAAAAGMPKKMG